jgi:DNA polymerase (family 10)
MKRLDAAEVASLLIEYGRRAALAGGNPYRARAYVRAAESLAAQAEPLERIITSKRLRDIPGVGEAIASVIEQLHRTGSHGALEKLREDVPDGVVDLLSIPGLQPEKAMRLYRELGIASLAELEAALADDTLWKTRSLSSALRRKIQQGLKVKSEAEGARHVHRAEQLLAAAQQNLRRGHKELEHIAIAGDFRRGSELVTDLSLVGVAPSIKGKTTSVASGDLTVHITDPKRFGITFLRATGSSEHLRQLTELARKKGLNLSPEGVLKRGKVVAAKTEAAIYKALGLDFIEPELREGRGEIELAARNALPKLLTDDDLRGVLHAHTVASDGANTLEQMANAARERGFQYFGVTDHSQSAHYAGGLSVQEIEEQHAEADRLNATFGTGFRIFKGIESDILADGSLDYPDDVLRRFDFIVASVHGQFRLDKKAQTQRILRAVANPFVTILGHMTGRQLLRRPGYDIDVDHILAACAKHGVAVEINANPWRLDLDWRYLQRGLELGCMFSIDPDAHDTGEIDNIRWGVAIARKGWIPKERVLNSLELVSFAAFLESRKQAALRKTRKKCRKTIA